MMVIKGPRGGSWFSWRDERYVRASGGRTSIIRLLEDAAAMDMPLVSLKEAVSTIGTGCSAFSPGSRPSALSTLAWGPGMAVALGYFLR